MNAGADSGRGVDTNDWLRELSRRAEQRFDAEKRVLSFGEYLSWVSAEPRVALRDAATYVRDMLDYYGSRAIDGPGGESTRYNLFDGVDGAEEHLVGHENLQQQFYAALTSFVREGRANRLLLLHGPNGSAKSTFVQCLFRGLEAYSRTDAGALYTFSWVFPRGKDGKSIGFGLEDKSDAGRRSFAHLAEADIDVRLTSEMREHPLHLISTDDRVPLLEQLLTKEQGALVPDWLRFGQMSRKNKAIFDALLTAYRGDLQRVLGHIRVERFYISERYRVGAATIGPEMAVDAKERQITADHSLGSLPASFASLTLYEAFGSLVDAAGGILEYSDLLKRPLDAWKYLLLATETGTVSLSLSTLALNAVLIANSNEVHLAAFREHHEYRSFRGRIHPIRVPYLRDYSAEQLIYDRQIVPQLRVDVAPHVTYVAALWATLTRLLRPAQEHYEDSKLGKLATSLTPIEKAELYASGQAPKRMKVEDRRLLASGRKEIYEEFQFGTVYEGLIGASAREIRAVLLEAGQGGVLTPIDVLERLEDMIEAGDYEFLKVKAEKGYMDHEGFIDVVRERWLDRVDDEFRTSAGFIDQGQHEDLFRRYVLHVSYWVKNEKVTNPHTGESEDPDTELMSRIERVLASEGEEEEFRRQVIGKVAAHAIDNAESDEQVDYVSFFPKHIEALREAYYEENKERLAKVLEMMQMLVRFAEDDSAEKPRTTTAAERQAIETGERAIRSLCDEHGYSMQSLKPVLSELKKERYP